MHRVLKKAIRRIKEGLGRKRFPSKTEIGNQNIRTFSLTDIESLPKISVVTPSYNQGRFLENCIDSVLAQNYPKLQYIIIDGGSTDQSLEIIKKHDKELARWVSEPDEGQGDAINKGFKRSTGDIVAWLNADDFYLPGAFATVAQAYQRKPEASFYFGNGWRVDETGQYKCDFSPEKCLCFSRSGFILGLNYILQPATFINRVHLVKLHYLNPSLRYGMDTDLWIRLSEIVSPEPISAFLAASREYGDTKTSTGSFERVEELRQIAEKYSGLPMTPGVLCYFLDTLHCLVGEREDIYPEPFIRKIETFWAETAKLMGNFGIRHDGFPSLWKHRSRTNDD